VSERGDLLVHGMSAVVDDDIEVGSVLVHELLEEFNIALVSRDDGGSGGLLGPFSSAVGVVLDEV
jgi:hypothetical protein